MPGFRHVGVKGLGLARIQGYISAVLVFVRALSFFMGFCKDVASVVRRSYKSMFVEVELWGFLKLWCLFPGYKQRFVGTGSLGFALRVPKYDGPRFRVYGLELEFMVSGLV